MDLTKEKSFISIAKYALVILLGSLLLIISARIQTPFVPVPATMQTFAVLFLGIAFSYKIAVLAVIIYLVEGRLRFAPPASEHYKVSAPNTKKFTFHIQKRDLGLIIGASGSKLRFRNRYPEQKTHF